jgi:hypothetical protein
MVNTDKVRVVQTYLRTAADAIQRALDVMPALKGNESHAVYITDQLERANEDFLLAAREWTRLTPAPGPHAGYHNPGVCECLICRAIRVTDNALSPGGN